MASFSFTDFLRFCRLLSVEPLGFLAMFIFLFKKNPIDQLIQDKLCLQKYLLPANYCHALPTMKNEDDYLSMKSTVLGNVTQFNMYIYISVAVPIFVISLLIGPFIDKYKPAKKFLFLYSSAIFAIESSLFLINSIWFDMSYWFILACQIVMSFSAGPLVAVTCCWSYVSLVTPEHTRSIRMIILELCTSAASIFATAAGGNLLDLTPIFPSRDPRNYIAIFSISIACSLLFLIIALFTVDAEKDKALFDLWFPKKFTETLPLKTTYFSSKEKQKTLLVNETAVESRSPIKIFLDLTNIKEMFQTFTKARPHNIRMQIVLLLISKTISQLASWGPTTFMFQFVQKVYSWNSSQYSNYLTGSYLINIITTFIFAPVIINIFKIGDLNYALLGSSMILIQNAIRLATPSLSAFWVSIAFNAINSMGMVGVQAYITKVTDGKEVGRIFSLMTVLDSTIPIISSVVFSQIFQKTIDTMPNLSFLPVVIGLLMGISFNFIVALKGKKTLQKVEEDRAVLEET